jgi:hypothetical protein
MTLLESNLIINVMKELKILYKELQERQEHLESKKKTKITEGRIAENLLTIIRVQQLLIPLVAQQNETSQDITESVPEFEIFLKSDPEDVIQINGWYPEYRKNIKNQKDIPKYIEMGLLRHNTG